MIPHEITDDHISSAAAKIDRDGLPPHRSAVHYDLVIGSKLYPPKYVISIAAELASGTEHPFNKFNAVEARDYFRNRGYEVIDRRDEEPIPATPKASDISNPAVERVSVTTYRILRDTELARRVKQIHNNRCQICGQTIELLDGETYAEAHHIRPLGHPHDGPDVGGNILCVCPNHHAQLDFGAIEIDLSSLRNSTEHVVGTEFVDYHNHRIS